MGAPLIYKSELIQTSSSEDEAFDSWGAPDSAIRTLTNFVLRGWSLGHPWTGEATLVFKSELSRTSYSGIEPWTDGAPLIYISELIQTSNSEDDAFDSWGAPDF